MPFSQFRYVIEAAESKVLFVRQSSSHCSFTRCIFENSRAELAIPPVGAATAWNSGEVRRTSERAGEFPRESEGSLPGRGGSPVDVAALSNGSVLIACTPLRHSCADFHGYAPLEPSLGRRHAARSRAYTYVRLRLRGPKWQPCGDYVTTLAFFFYSSDAAGTRSPGSGELPMFRCCTRGSVVPCF